MHVVKIQYAADAYRVGSHLYRHRKKYYRAYQVGAAVATGLGAAAYTGFNNLRTAYQTTTRMPRRPRNQVFATRKFPHSKKRVRAEEGTGQNAVMPSHAGGKIAINYRQAKGTYKNKNASRGSAINTILLKEMQCSIISRFQYYNVSNNPYATAGTTGITDVKLWSLGKQWANVAKTEMWMPVFAFNLTSMARNQTMTSYTCPMYRLKKVVKATGLLDSTTHNYIWSDQSNANEQLRGSAGDGSTQNPWWIVEKAIGNNATATPRTHNKYILDWASAALTFNATAMSKIHVATVSFNNIYAGPRRQFFNSLTPAWTTYDPEEVQAVGQQNDLTSKADLWWDHFLATKTVHPTRSVDQIVKSKAVKFHTNECICIDGDSTITGGVQRKAVYKKDLFFPFSQLFSCINATTAESKHNAFINTDVDPVNGWLYPGYNTTNVNDFQGFYPERNKDVWLLIYADDFDTPVATTAEGQLNENVLKPQFEIVAKQKVTYSTL